MGLPRYNEAGFTHYEWETLKMKIPEECGYNKKFKYNTRLNAMGVSGDSVEWAAKNLQEPWGWFFDEDRTAIMSFENPDDMAYWLLVNYGKQHREQY